MLNGERRTLSPSHSPRPRGRLTRPPSGRYAWEFGTTGAYTQYLWLRKPLLGIDDGAA